MKTLLQDLIKHNIHLQLAEGALSVKIPKSGTDPSLINKIKANKKELIQYLSDLKNDAKSIPVQPKQASYVLSKEQQRIYKLSQMQGGSRAFNIPGTIEIQIELRYDMFVKAICQVISRHEILRTVFRENEQQDIEQFILSREAIDFNIDYIDVSDRPDFSTILSDYINEDAFRPFDLANGPMLKGCLFKMGDNHYIFYYNMHSIIADGESIEVFTQEVMLFLEAFKKNTASVLEAMRIQYKDFASWQRDALLKDAFKQHREYWREYLSGVLPMLNLNFQNERPEVRTFNGELLGLGISEETTKKLKKFVSDHGGNLFMAILAFYKLLLYLFSSQETQVIGTPALGRDHSDIQGQMGPYVNMIPLRGRVYPPKEFLEFYDEIKQSVLDSYSFQMYPYEQLLEDLNLTSNTNRNPLFDSVLLLQREEQALEDFQLNELNTNTIIEGGIGKKYVVTITSKYDLEVDFRELGGCLWFNVQYNTDLYERKHMEDFIFTFKNLFNHILDNPKQSIGDLLEPFFEDRASR